MTSLLTETAREAMSRERKRYHYEPLNSDRNIRLLCIFRHSSGQIGCTLIESPVKPPVQPYIALSYTWGNSEPVDSVITGEDDELPVTPNLYAFLKKMVRSDHAHHLFWIDQLCINQSDNAEKSVQVTMMGDVYQCASEVIVWLGEGSEESAEGLKTIQHVASRTLQHERELGVEKYAQEMQRMRWEVAVAPKPKDPPWASAGSILCRPWFQRVWVTQEIAFARSATVLCGDSAISWGALAAFADRISKYKLDSLILRTEQVQREEAAEIRGLKQINKMHLIQQNRRQKEKSDIADLIVVSQTFLATDLRDKLYAFYSLVDSEMPRPDYDQTVVQVYTDFMATILCESSRPELLSLAGTGSRGRMPGLPSWVADWSHSPKEVALGRMSWFRASGNSKSSFTISKGHDSNSSHLCCRAVFLDMILARGPDHPEDADGGKSMLAYIAQCKELAATHESELNTIGQTAEDTFWRTLVANSVLDGSTAAPDSFAQKYRSWIQTCEISVSGVAPPELKVRGQEVLNESNEFNVVYNGSGGWRRFFVTYSGSTGIGPSGLREDDAVVLIAGTKVAWVLREKPSLLEDTSAGSREEELTEAGQTLALDGKPKPYELVGECYVHGLMSGEGWDGDETVGIRIE